MTARSRLRAAAQRIWRAFPPRPRPATPPEAQRPATRPSGPPWGDAPRPRRLFPSILPLADLHAGRLAMRAHIQATYALADLPTATYLAGKGWL